MDRVRTLITTRLTDALRALHDQGHLKAPFLSGMRGRSLDHSRRYEFTEWGWLAVHGNPSLSTDEEPAHLDLDHQVTREKLTAQLHEAVRSIAGVKCRIEPDEEGNFAACIVYDGWKGPEVAHRYQDTQARAEGRVLHDVLILLSALPLA